MHLIIQLMYQQFGYSCYVCSRWDKYITYNINIRPIHIFTLRIYMDQVTKKSQYVHYSMHDLKLMWNTDCLKWEIMGRIQNYLALHNFTSYCKLRLISTWHNFINWPNIGYKFYCNLKWIRKRKLESINWRKTNVDSWPTTNNWN